MTGCNKYKVIWRSGDTQEIENWINDLYENEGLELVAFSDNDFIFKRNTYIKSIKPTRFFGDHDKLD